jgi:pSer/pThr/pTyr-binding forkhead associated (FHA) protein
MQLSLLVMRGLHEGKEILVSQPHFSIGRDMTCDLRARSLAISRRHAAILSRSGQVLVCDLGSRNGTFVNEVPVAGECELRHNDLLRLGPLEFRVLVRPTVAAEDFPFLPHESHKEAASALAGSSPGENKAPSRLSSGSSGPFSSSASSVVPGWVFPASGADLLKQYLGRLHL